MITAIILCVCVIAIMKALSYYFALYGVLYYLVERYNDELDDKTIKKYIREAINNMFIDKR